MAAAGGGSIVNIGSVSWIIGQSGMPCYTAAKAAVAGLTRSLARDLGPYNIRVNSVLLGWILTQRQIDKWLTPDGEQELLARVVLFSPPPTAVSAQTRITLPTAAGHEKACPD